MKVYTCTFLLPFHFPCNSVNHVHNPTKLIKLTHVLLLPLSHLFEIPTEMLQIYSEWANLIFISHICKVTRIFIALFSAGHAQQSLIIIVLVHNTVCLNVRHLSFL